MDQTPRQTVRKRHVFYIPGYDPVPPRRYRELYRTEGAEQAQISGYKLTMQPKPKGQENFGWGVLSDIDGEETRSTFEILYWADLVQGSMDKSIPATYWLLARTAFEYIATGALFRLMKLRMGPIIAALYPVVMLLAQLVLAISLALAVWWLGDAVDFGWTGLALGVFAGIAVLRFFKRKDARLFAYYLMHDYGYSALYRGQNPPELEDRMAAFTARIAQIMRSDVDEVLVVGHSSGAHLAVSILSDLVRSGEADQKRPQLGLLTLGQVIPMVSFLRGADRLRGDLNYLCQREEISWVDVTAPGDGATFALCDPAAVSGVAPKGGHLHPLIVSAAYTQTLSDEKRAELGRRFFRLHFQYLCAFDKPGDYDYFRITAGPRTLGAHFAHRGHSPSRIDTPVNRFTSMVPT